MSRSAIVTGAAAGMGAKIAQLLGERGYHLTLLDLDGVALEATAQRITSLRSVAASVNIRTAQCNVTNHGRLSNLFIEHVANFGGVDVVVNNAGIAEKVDLFSDPQQRSNWRSVLDVDLAAVIEGTRLAVELMTSTRAPAGTTGAAAAPSYVNDANDDAAASPPARRYARGGVVVNVASAGGLLPMPFSPVYAAAKAGVVMFCRSLDSLAHREGTPVAVRAFCPQFVDTAFVADAFSDVKGEANAAPSVLPTVQAKDLIAATGGRLITVDEAAAACVELLVDPGPQFSSHSAKAAPTATAAAAAALDPPSCALFLTTDGPRWWHFGKGRRRDRDNKNGAGSDNSSLINRSRL